MKKYNVDYFIDFFKKIPPNKFSETLYGEDGAKCYVGHLGGANYQRLDKFVNLLHKYLDLDAATICYKWDKSPYRQKSLKKRILSALLDIKQMKSNETALSTNKIKENELSVAN